jgi:hypothetical protein
MAGSLLGMVHLLIELVRAKLSIVCEGQPSFLGMLPVCFSTLKNMRVLCRQRLRSRVVFCPSLGEAEAEVGFV